MHVYAGIEAGGTKFNCIIGKGPDELIEETIRIPTTTPAETLKKVLRFFEDYQLRTGNYIAGLGIGSFGPVDLNTDSPTFGYITSTPKPGWQNTEIVGYFKRHLGVPTFFETDVTAAAMGEHIWGAAQELDDFVYTTVGTGIGSGIFANGKPVHGLVHPESGHILLPQDPAVDTFPGVCPFHKGCFEGLCTGPSLRARTGVPAEELPADHPAWALEAHYIALAMSNFICMYSPRKLILGGGVMEQKHLFPLIRAEVQQTLNGYVQSPAILEHIDEYIVPPALGGKAGMLGSLALAMQ